MLQGYFEQQMNESAVFEFFVRKLPRNRNFLMAVGLEQALSLLENLQFTREEIEWLASTGKFRRAFLHFLGGVRFTGDVHAMPEGTLFFPNEPILRVTAPMPEAQLVETRLINLLQFETMIASKAARCVLVAPGKTLVDFGLRHAHGVEAGLLAARASYLAGFSGTSTVEAGKLWNIPIFGTMAHSFVQAHESECEAFEHFARANSDNATLLLDTYDTEGAAQLVVQLAPKLKADGINIQAVRLDSGDLGEHARQVRKILNEGGLPEVRIVASGALDEFALETLADAPIDSFGIGTRLDTSADAPHLDCAYKLVEYAGRLCLKRSEGKATLPGRKQVFRSYDKRGQFAGDILTLEGDFQSGEALLHPVMRAGKRLSSPTPLAEIREHAVNELHRLPVQLRRLESVGRSYEVRLSAALESAFAGSRKVETP
jgi:nicotinate phosphoribosyltransferase